MKLKSHHYILLSQAIALCIIAFVSATVLAKSTQSSQSNQSDSGAKDIIERVSSDAIVVDGAAYELKDNATVEKKGFTFSVSDLRPGWRVTLDKYGSKVRKVHVAAIPAVNIYPEYNGLRTTVAVGRVRMGNLSPELLQNSVDLQSALESMILAALQATHHFLVIDIRSRDEMLNETDFSQSEYANPELTKNSGRQIPADYIIRTHVLSFGAEQKKGKGFGAFGFKVGSKSTKYQLKMELTMEDVATGIVSQSTTYELTYDSKGSALGISAAGLASSLSSFTSDLGKLSSLQKVAGTGLQISGDSYCESPIGEVCGIVTNRLVEQLMAAIADKPWRSVVVHASDKQCIIRGGSDVGLQIGTELRVFKSSEELVDPETGLSLGDISAPIGQLIVREVKDKISICEYHGNSNPARGDKCVIVTASLHGQL